METFLITLALIALSGVIVFAFFIEPRLWH